MRIRGPITPRRMPSAAALAALASGDTTALLDASKAEFGDNVFTMMADDDGADDDDDDDDDDDASGDDDDTDDSKKDADKDDDDDKSDSDMEALRARMKAADKRAAKAEARLKEIEDAKKDDLTKAQDEVTELTEKVESLQSELSGLRLQNAFLTANKHSWHDPDTALALAQSKKYLDDVADEETGEVDKSALTKALDRLAKEHAYLVKSEKNDKDDEPDGPSGEPAGGRSDNTKDEKARQQKMRGRFPVLNR